MKLSFKTLAYSGFWQCLVCERPSEPIGDAGSPWARCKYCKMPALKWIPPVLKPDSMLAERN